MVRQLKIVMVKRSFSKQLYKGNKCEIREAMREKR